MSQLGLLTGFPQIIGAQMIRNTSYHWHTQLFLVEKKHLVVGADAAVWAGCHVILSNFVNQKMQFGLFIALAHTSSGLLNSAAPNWRALW